MILQFLRDTWHLWAWLVFVYFLRWAVPRAWHIWRSLAIALCASVAIGVQAEPATEETLAAMSATMTAQTALLTAQAADLAELHKEGTTQRRLMGAILGLGLVAAIFRYVRV
jgi:phosphotransferase system  glucose/maltose/N-acetylglucosamine-specific IIC component